MKIKFLPLALAAIGILGLSTSSVRPAFAGQGVEDYCTSVGMEYDHVGYCVYPGLILLPFSEGLISAEKTLLGYHVILSSTEDGIILDILLDHNRGIRSFQTGDKWVAEIFRDSITRMLNRLDETLNQSF